MAKSKSKSTTPSSAENALNGFKQDLYKILDGLNTQITKDASNESSALGSFITAEETMISKSTSFGGPLPYFISPSWEGSKTPNGSRSYKKTFEPIIKNVLSQKTAKTDEHDLNMESLKINLENVFKTVFEQQKIKASMTEKIGIPWVQDSIIEANALLGVPDQVGLVNFLTTAILKGTGLPTIPASPPKNYSPWADAYLPWLKKEIKAYYAQSTKGPDIQKVTDQVLALLQSTLKKYNQNNEDSIREWISITITNAPSTIPITNLQKEELVGALEQEITMMFPQPDASFFFKNLQTVLLQNIYNPPVSTTISKKVIDAAPKTLAVEAIALNTTASAGTITAIATGGSIPPGGSYQYFWTNITTPTSPVIINNDPKLDTVTNLSPGTYQVEVLDASLQSAKATATVLKSNLVLPAQSISQHNVSLNGGDDGSATVKALGGTTPYTFEWKNIETLATATGTTANDKKTNTLTGMVAGDYIVTVTDHKGNKASAYLTITQPAYSANNGIKYLIEKILGITKSNDPTNQGLKKLAAKLEHAFKEVIKISITKTFNDLPEYGSQGRLMASTYDYQLISRISDYTTALVDEMKHDFNNYIPNNSANALKAAQDITSTAVAFREFASSLPDITSAFKSELNHDQSGGTKKGQPGYTYGEIDAIINKYPVKQLEDLAQLADAVYLSTGKNVPLIKKAELQGVTLASSTAGLNTSLSKLLSGEQATTLTSLSQMKAKAKANFDSAYKAYETKATAYFTEMDSYITAKQDFNYDMLKLEAVQNALNTLTQVMEKGIAHAGSSNVYASPKT